MEKLTFDFDVAAGEMARMRRMYPLINGLDDFEQDPFLVDSFNMENRAYIYACLSSVAYSNNTATYADFEPQGGIEIENPIHLLLEKLGYVVSRPDTRAGRPAVVRVSFQEQLALEQYRGYSNGHIDHEELGVREHAKVMRLIKLDPDDELNTVELVNEYDKVAATRDIAIPYYEKRLEAKKVGELARRETVRKRYMARRAKQLEEREAGKEGVKPGKVAQ